MTTSAKQIEPAVGQVWQTPRSTLRLHVTHVDEAVVKYHWLVASSGYDYGESIAPREAWDFWAANARLVRGGDDD